jgi:2,3-bisphosphoglycerate-dependent phosphoglycerate mutase
VTYGTLTLLRHGQTTYNEQHRMTGLADPPLTELGEQQARDAGALLKDIPIDIVYSSTLSRAFNTAALVQESAGKNLPIEQRKELVEQDVGDCTGLSREKDTEVSDRNMTYDEPWPNGNSVKDVVECVRKLYEEEIKPRLERGENVLIVAHYVVLHAFEIVLGVTPVPVMLDKNKKIPNATPIVYSFDEKGNVQSVSTITKAANANAPAVNNKQQRPQP